MISIPMAINKSSLKKSFKRFCFFEIAERVFSKDYMFTEKMRILTLNVKEV